MWNENKNKLLRSWRENHLKLIPVFLLSSSNLLQMYGAGLLHTPSKLAIDSTADGSWFSLNPSQF
jgi:hypothetical protein